MAYVIHKQVLEFATSVSVSVPENSRILTVGIDPLGIIAVWYAFDEHTETNEEILIYLVFTGEYVDLPILKANYLGTFMKGPFIVHTFYKSSKSDTAIHATQEDVQRSHSRLM